MLAFSGAASDMCNLELTFAFLFLGVECMNELLTELLTARTKKEIEYIMFVDNYINPKKDRMSPSDKI